MTPKKLRNLTGDSFFAWDGDVLLVNTLGKPSASKDTIGATLAFSVDGPEA